MELARRPHGAALDAFADAVGAHGPVCVRGGSTKWDVAGLPNTGTHEVMAPRGITELEPAELVVRCGAGTTVGALDEALREHGLMTPLDDLRADEATIGGVLAVGRSGHRRLRYGHVRDLLLEARYVDAQGSLVKAGAPVVKNVTGFDLCRLLVGSLGTIGLIGEVVLRCRPRPSVAAWYLSTDAEPFVARHALFAPSSILWDGARTWVLLEGDPVDVDAEHRTLSGVGSAWTECAPPAIPDGRASLRPRDLRTLVPDGRWLAEVGVGTVHGMTATSPPPANATLFRDLKRAYDPDGRLNPGRQPW